MARRFIGLTFNSDFVKTSHSICLAQVVHVNGCLIKSLLIRDCDFIAYIVIFLYVQNIMDLLRVKGSSLSNWDGFLMLSRLLI